ncbi:CAP domain-containing protein, partial [Cyathus striatus]
NSPGFSSASGHFTQVVWKSTTSVACAITSCPAGTIFGQASKYVVCRYAPPGNYPGQF